MRAAGDVKELDTALERARALMTLEDQGNARPVAAMEEKQGEKTQVGGCDGSSGRWDGTCV